VKPAIAVAPSAAAPPIAVKPAPRPGRPLAVKPVVKPGKDKPGAAVPGSDMGF